MDIDVTEDREEGRGTHCLVVIHPLTRFHHGVVAIFRRINGARVQLVNGECKCDGFSAAAGVHLVDERMG